MTEPKGRAGNKRLIKIAGAKAPHIDWVKSVYVLFWRDQFDNCCLIDLFRQRQLHQNAVNGGVVVELFNNGDDFFLCGRCRERFFGSM